MIPEVSPDNITFFNTKVQFLMSLMNSSIVWTSGLLHGRGRERESEKERERE